MSDTTGMRSRLMAVLAVAVIAIIGVFFATKGDMMPPKAPTLESGRWTLQSINDTPVAPDNAPYFEVTEGLIKGNDGCNGFSGPLADPGKIRLGQRGCPDDYTALPLEFSDPKGQLDQAIFNDQNLTIQTSDGGTATFILTAPK